MKSNYVYEGLYLIQHHIHDWIHCLISFSMSICMYHSPSSNCFQTVTNLKKICGRSQRRSEAGKQVSCIAIITLISFFYILHILKIRIDSVNTNERTFYKLLINLLYFIKILCNPHHNYYFKMLYSSLKHFFYQKHYE